MNGGKAKTLRKQAEQENIGNAKEYQCHKKSIYEVSGNRYCSTLELKNCTRKAYQQLKKQEV
jgi:hypothetical protein